MDRRNFIKISAITAGGVALEGCGHPEIKLVRFLPEEELTPGIAHWKPSLCRQCSAGCGVWVRLMDGEVEIVRNGERGLLPRKLAKKLEGNPEHPVNGGKLCARGQAALQLTYNPDRIRGPLKRTGERGSGQYEEISWEAALTELTARLKALQGKGKDRSPAFLSSPLRGPRRRLADRFLSAFGASGRTEYEFFGEPVLRRASGISFGRYALPAFDLANCNYLISFGADFLGTWLSPVSQADGFGRMIQGRDGRRGKVVQFEARMTPTGGKADEWVPVRPGREGVVALGIAHVLMKEGLRTPASAGQAGRAIEGWSAGLPEFTPERVEEITSVKADRLIRLAGEIASHTPATIMIGGPALAHTNGLFSALAVNALNALVGSLGSPGGLSFTPAPPLPGLTDGGTGRNSANSIQELAQQILTGKPAPIEVLLLSDANPVFSSPPGWQIREALDRVPFIASFGMMLDETSALADLILPDHSPLESWQDDVPETGTLQATVSLAAPAMAPLFNTRATADVLLDVARRLGERVAARLPWKDYEEFLKEQLRPLVGRAGGSIETNDFNQFWNQALENGGWWETTARSAKTSTGTAVKPAAYEPPQLDGNEDTYPFHLQPYASQSFIDGRHANIPWLQEMPEVLPTARWGSWVEINPQTAERLGIREGDLLAVASAHGKVEAPALIYPGIAPDMVAMPMGQGHKHLGRYAKDRGVNPAAILAPLTEPETGALAWAATRVQIKKIGRGRPILIKAAGSLEERPAEQFPR